MGQLYQLPRGRVVNLYDHPTFAAGKFCRRCRRMISKWHEHLTKESESVESDAAREVKALNAEGCRANLPGAPT